MPSSGQFGKDRPFWITGPLADKGLGFHSMTGSEQLSSLYELNVTLVSEKGDLALDDCLGEGLTVSMQLAGTAERHFHGIVTRFGLVGQTQNHVIYRATVRPRLWLLTRRADCRIFQDMTVAQILKKVLDSYQVKFDSKLSGTHNTRDYCVQYRETDFNFVSRLMEHEGIYYYFTHEEGEHTLVMTDQLDPGYKIAGYDTVHYLPPTENVLAGSDHIHEFALSREVQPGNYAQTDWDFEKPKAGLATKSSKTRGSDSAKLEIYDYPGDYTDTDQGKWYAQCRLEELQSQYERVQGAGIVRGLAPGARFKLKDFAREDQNREYQVVSTTHDMRTSQSFSGQDAPASYACTFTAMDGKQQFRSPRVAERSVVGGPQTAIVVGPQGEEIYTDKYGRVKVLFHWDRSHSYAQGDYDQNTSCWVRVAQVWGGKAWGAIQIPRIGHEVVVEFLEGDPDRPLITGSVYNAEMMPPYELPANMTQSGMKSRSSKGASTPHFNEFRFEDKKGEEHVLLHSEKDQGIEVENDETHWVGQDRKKTIDRDETSEIKRNRTETVGDNEQISIGKNRTESVSGNETISIGANRTESVEKDETISIAGNRSTSIEKNETIAVAGARNETVAKDEEIKIEGQQTISISKSRSVSIEVNDLQKIGEKFSLVAGEEIAFKTGDASITLKKDGTILIKGKDITVEGSGKINAKAAAEMVLKGSKIGAN